MPEVISEAKAKISGKLSVEDTDFSLKEKRTKNSVCDKISVFSKPGEKQFVPRNTRKTRMSQSFSILSTEKISENVECEKLNKSCVELPLLSDSDDIIPSSQGSSENENTIKLSVNNGLQKSQLPDESDLNKSPRHFLSTENNNVSHESENFVTSTPSKSHFPSLSDANETYELSNKKNECELTNSLAPVDSNVKNDLNKEPFDKVIEKHQEIISENICQCKESDIQVNSNEIITDMGTLLDAVDVLVKTTSEKSDSEPVSNYSQPAIEMKDVSELSMKTKDLYSSNSEKNTITKSDSPNEIDKIKSRLPCSHIPVNSNVSVLQSKMVTPIDSSIVEKIPSPYEPIAKRSRLSLKQSEICSQNENYSQKLRKKNTNTESKPQQKPRKKKAIKKDDILSKNVKNKLKDKNNFEPSMHSENVEANKICDFVEDKVANEKEYISVQPNNFKNSENIDLNIKCSANNISKKDVDSVSPSLENSNENSNQNIENTESCEIFEMCSNNSEDFQDVNNIIPPEESESSQSSLQSSNDTSNDSQESKTSKQNETYDPSVDNINGDNHERISEIPCSLENGTSSYLSKEVNVENSKIELCNVQQSESLNEIDKNKKDAENEIDSNVSSIKFSVIEDDLSCEMHHIIDSVVGVNCKDSLSNDLPNSISINLPANQSDSVQMVENIQNLSDPIISSDRESLTCDTKSVLSVSGEKEKYDAELSPNKIRNNQFPIECKENISNSIEEYNSSDVIMSSNTQCDSECSVEILVNSAVADTQIVNQNFANHGEINVTETKLNDKSVSQSDNFSPELDHSYSTKQGEDESIGNKLEDDSNSSEEIDVVTVDPLCMHNLSTSGHEISCLMRDLVILVERFDAGNYYSSADKNHENIVKTDIKIIPSNSNHASNKENEDLVSNNDIKLAKGSKRRKIKPPIRSPFNFRQRAKLESPKKVPPKGIKTLNVTRIKSLSESKDLVIKSLFHKDDLKDEDETDNSMAKIISSIVDSITVEDDVKTEVIPHIPSSSHIPKTPRLGLSNDELTDLNTRLNAQMAHQTRRMKVIADSQTSVEDDSESLHSTEVSANPEDSSTNLSSILKKRKASGEVPPKKVCYINFFVN